MRADAESYLIGLHTLGQYVVFVGCGPRNSGQDTLSCSRYSGTAQRYCSSSCSPEVAAFQPRNISLTSPGIDRSNAPLSLRLVAGVVVKQAPTKKLRAT